MSTASCAKLGLWTKGRIRTSYWFCEFEHSPLVGVAVNSFASIFGGAAYTYVATGELWEWVVLYSKKRTQREF